MIKLKLNEGVDVQAILDYGFREVLPQHANNTTSKYYFHVEGRELGDYTPTISIEKDGYVKLYIVQDTDIPDIEDYYSGEDKSYNTNAFEWKIRETLGEEVEATRILSTILDLIRKGILVQE